jgi:hypothetical protein
MHTNCTSGIEAVLAGRRVLNMQPNAVPRGDFDKEVAKEAGVSANSIRDAVEKAVALLSAPPTTQVWSTHAHAMLANLKTEAVPMLANETLSVLREEQIDSSHVVLPPKDSLRNLVRRALNRSALDRYIASKRGPLELNHIEMMIDGYQSQGKGGPHPVLDSRLCRH